MTKMKPGLAVREEQWKTSKEPSEAQAERARWRSRLAATERFKEL